MGNRTRPCQRCERSVRDKGGRARSPPHPLASLRGASALSSGPPIRSATLASCPFWESVPPGASAHAVPSPQNASPARFVQLPRTLRCDRGAWSALLLPTRPHAPPRTRTDGPSCRPPERPVRGRQLYFQSSSLTRLQIWGWEPCSLRSPHCLGFLGLPRRSATVLKQQTLTPSQFWGPEV